MARIGWSLSQPLPATWLVRPVYPEQLDFHGDVIHIDLDHENVIRPTVWYDGNIMGHIVIPDQPGPDAGIMDWSRYLSELDKLPQDDEGVRVAIQGVRDMIAELEWLKPEGPENPR